VERFGGLINREAREEYQLDDLRSRRSFTCAAFLQVWRCRDRQLVRGSIEDEFQAADVAAINAIGFWSLAIVADLGLARGTFPWHRAL